MGKPLGPNFPYELEAAGLVGLPISWAGDSDTITGRENLTPEQNTQLDAVIAAHDPALHDPILVADTWIDRFTDSEYNAMEKSTNSKITKRLHKIIIRGQLNVDNNIKNFLVSDGILTQARADVIFARD
jgi:hypothetical protein